MQYKLLCVVYITYKYVCVAKIAVFYTQTRRNIMWTTPSATEMRFGFEVTMYVMNK
jgi:pyrroloquinoline quinone biosynthesis protein A